MADMHRILDKKATGIHQNHLFPHFGLEKSASSQQDLSAALESQRIRVVILSGDTASVADHHLLIGDHLTVIKLADSLKTVLLDKPITMVN